MLGAGPLDPDFERTPRANPRARDGLLTRVYGDRTYFREVSPWEIANRNAPAIAKDSLVRVAVGDRDGTFALNEEFHRHLESLSVPHEWIPLTGIEHDPMKTLEALGDRNWDFYRRAFGAPAAPAARQDGEVKLKVGDAERRAIVVNVPPEGQVRPAVLILHGGSGSAERMRANSGFDPLARAEGFMAVYAEGTDFGGDRHAWNTGHLLRRQVRDADDIAYFDALIDMLVGELGADPARIFMTGGSNGGMMTFAYAVARPRRLAAAAPVVASMFAFDRVPEVPMPILIINGAKDEEVPLEGGMSRNRVVRLAQATPFKPVTEVVDFWVKANKSVAPGTMKTDGTVTTTTYAAGDGGAVTEFVLDSAGGHGWPGTRERREGNVPITAFAGAERVWRFFKGKSRAVVATPHAVEILEFPDLVDASRAAPRRVPVKVHVPGAGGPYPVVIVSHGAGGGWDTHFAQAQDLASHGYAILCVEHVGSNRDRLLKGMRPMRNIDAMTRDADEVLARPRDVSFAIDRAAGWNRDHAELKGRLDLGRVAVMGHSFGAYTTMVACGMRPALDWLVPEVAPGQGLGPDLSDRRVRCGIALSPQAPGEPFFLPESFRSLRVPLLGISGSKDVQQAGRTPDDRREAFELWPPGDHRFVWLANAQHLDFSDSTGSDDRALPSATRADVQPITRAAMRAFLDLHLKSDAAAGRRLTVEGLKPFLRGGIDGVDVLAK
jgi:poly(3-hydroxybutyrate) depolymerase/predicted dienelactone hydrolase